MKETADNRSKVFNIISVLVLASGLLLAFYYIFAKEIVTYNIDYTDSLFWAAASADSGSLINYDYWYVYIIPFSGSLFMIPLVKLLGVSYLAHELGMAIFVVVMAAAVFFGLKALKETTARAAFTTGILLIAMNISLATRVIFFGHVIHYSLALTFTSVAFILLDKTGCLSEGKFTKKQWILYILLVVWCGLCCLNGSSALVLFMLPLAGALVLDRLLDKSEISFLNVKVPLLRLAGVMCGAAVGFLYKRYRITPFFDSSYEEKFSALLGHEDWLWKEQGLMTKFIILLTGSVYKDTPMLSGEGIIVMIRLVLGILLLLIPVAAIFFYRKYENRMMRLLLLDYWVLFILTYLSYGVSIVQNESWRLGALFGMAVLFDMVFLFWLIKQEFIKRFGYIALAYICVSMLTVPLSVYMLPGDPELNGYVRMAHVLEENGLTYGYSGMWGGACVVNVITDSRVRIAMVSYDDDGSYKIVRYQTQASWYEDQPGVDKYFAVVPNEKLENVKDTLVKNAVDSIPFEDSTILVFDRNIFKDGQPVFAQTD